MTPAHSFVTAFIGLGSNLDHPRQQVEQGIAALAQLPDTQLQAVSPWYGSTAVGGDSGQPDYVNGVAQLHTRLPPLTLLHALQAIEYAQGRVRTVRWGARTLDLDLLLYDHHTATDPELTLPHPRLHERAFVLRPLADIAPDLTLPNGLAIRSLLDTVDTSGTWLLNAMPTTLPSAAHSTSQDRSNP